MTDDGMQLVEVFPMRDATDEGLTCQRFIFSPNLSFPLESTPDLVFWKKKIECIIDQRVQ